MGGKGDSPDLPDFQALADQTAQSSLVNTNMQTLANRPTRNTPWGQEVWTREAVPDPTTGEYNYAWTQDINLTPEQQASLDAQQRIQEGRSGIAESLLGRAGDEFSETMDWSQYGDFTTAPDVPQYDRGALDPRVAAPEAGQYDSSGRYVNEARDAVLGQFDERMQPRFQDQQQQLEVRLRNQGLRPGDRAYDTAMERLSEDQADATRMAEREAILMGGAEAQRMLGMDLSAGGQRFTEGMGLATLGDTRRAADVSEMLGFGGQAFGQGMQAAGFNNQVRNAQIAEEMQRRGFSLNEINAILTGQQVGMPGFQDFNAAARVQTPDYIGAGQAQAGATLDQFGIEQAQRQALYSGLGDLAGVGLSMWG